MTSRYYLIVLGLVLVSACNSRDSNAPANSPAGASPATANSPSTSAATPAGAVKASVDVCSLLTADDLKNVQGEAYKDAMRSDRLDGDFIVAQCYYALPTTTNSVVLNVTTAKPVTGAPSPRAFWESTFGKEEAGSKPGKEGEREKERDKERAEKKRTEPGAEVEQEAKPEKINGLGDEAFWLGSRVGGALYVLKKDLYFRISVGGAGDEKAKLNKSKTLAQRVLTKL